MNRNIDLFQTGLMKLNYDIRILVKRIANSRSLMSVIYIVKFGYFSCHLTKRY